MKTISKNLWKFSSVFALALVIFGFFYFETSMMLQVLILVLALISLFSLRSTGEILILLILYLGLYDLYNLRYSLAIPLFLMILAVFGLTLFVFLSWINLRPVSQNLDKNILWLYTVTVGFIAMEIFLTMSFWPVETKIKSFAIVVVFYIISRIFYLYINNVLNLKKIVVFTLISLLILGLVFIFNILMFFGFLR